MYIYINKEAVKTKLKKLAKPVAIATTAILVVGGVVVMVERFSRTSDGSHDLSI